MDAELFVYLRVPAALEPAERGDRIEDPLQKALAREGLGEVTGGGSSLSEERPDGSRVVEWCGVDVDVTNLHRALELMRATLPVLGLPDGSVLDYTCGGTKLRDAFERGTWKIGEPRSELHPGFEV